jgi:vancomycin resistance protein YoaR
MATRWNEGVVRVVLAVAMAAAPSIAMASNESGDGQPDASDAQAEAPSIAIGEHATEYVSWGRNRRRAHNVELAASRLDGAWIAPGAELSFDQRVGPRSRDAGFREAPVIASGRLRQGMGGGVCQVTTTLHLAAMEAGLEIVEHRVHTFPSHYVAPGLDATVAEGRIDYRVRNPHPFPVFVRANASDGTLRVSLLGTRAIPPVHVRATVVRELSLPDELQEDPTLPRGQQELVQEGRVGYVVLVVRSTEAGELDRERVRYAPAARVVRVGVGGGA